MRLPAETITNVIGFCNRDLVPDQAFNPANLYHSEWFSNYFSFLSDSLVQSQLGDAFYQARFMYKLMNALNLPLAKHKGIVKFQIIQYASICEAVLDLALIKYFKDDFEEQFAVYEFVKYPNAVAADVRITGNGTPLTICKTKKKKADLKRTRVDFKTKYAVEKGLISQELKDKVDNLYDMRNNIHILKAANSHYIPKLKEGKEAFLLMQQFVDSVKLYYSTH